MALSRSRNVLRKADPPSRRRLLATRSMQKKTKLIRKELSKLKKIAIREAAETRRSMEEFEELKAAVQAKQIEVILEKEEYDQSIAEMLVLTVIESILLEALFGPSGNN